MEEVSFERAQIRLLAAIVGQLAGILVVNELLPEAWAEQMLAAIDTGSPPSTELIDRLRWGLDKIVAAHRPGEFRTSELPPG